MRSLLMPLLLVAAGYTLAGEGERFYQVVGPDGRLQTVRAPEAATKAPAEAVAKETALPAAQEKENKIGDSRSVAPQQAAELKPAPYDGDTYLDSDQLESSGFNPEKRKKFFITSDGTRQRVEENLMPATGDNPYEAPLAARPESEKRDHTELASVFNEIDPKAVSGLAHMCINPGQAQPVADEAARLREDKRSVYFSKSEPLVAAYVVKGQGLRTVQLRSYADGIKSPAFFSPYIGLADDNGCLLRVLDNYFQRNYAVTKTQYEMLEADITLHGEERYLLVLRSAQPAAPLQPELAYTKSPYGQISLKLLK